MQPMKSRVLRGPTLNLVGRSFGYNVNPVSDYSGIQARENVEVDEWVQHHAPGSTKILGFANGIFRQQLAGQSRIHKASPHHGLSNAISCTNPGIHQSTRGLRMICGLCLKEDDFSKGPSRTLSNKLWRSGALVDEGLGYRKGELRWEFEPRIVGFRGTVRSLYTEIKGDKRGDEKSEDITKLRRVRSPVKVKASTSKRKRIVRVASSSIPRKPAIDLEVANDVSIREKDMDCLPASSAGLGFKSQSYREEELERVGAHVSLELDHDDVEENHNSLGARGQIVQKPLPSLGFQHITVKEDEEIRRRSSFQAMALLRAALDEADEEEGKVAEEFQRSLRVGIVGAPNAGKSLLTNQLVGTRVSAVSRKTNTTHREHLGVFTKGDTQLLYYDTPGLHLDIEGSPLRVDAQHRVRNAWEIVDFCEALLVLVDAERQIRRPDKRVQRLVEKLGKEENDFQKRVLVLNKVDIIEQKRLLLPLAKQFEDLLGFDRIFMISGLTGSGVKDVKDYLVNQAVLRPWDEDPELKDHRDVALEVVREQVFEHLHEELPHTTRQKIVSWKVLKDGSIRIQQLLLVAKKEHQKILVGKNGAVIGGGHSTLSRSDPSLLRPFTHPLVTLQRYWHQGTKGADEYFGSYCALNIGRETNDGNDRE